MLIEGLAGLLGKRLEIGALRASHGLFAGGPLVGVFEHEELPYAQLESHTRSSTISGRIWRPDT